VTRFIHDEGNLPECTSTGIQAANAQGEDQFIALVDSDIVLHPDFFTIIQKFKPDTGAIAARFELTEPSLIAEHYRLREDFGAIRNVGLVETHKGLASACTIYRASVLRKCLPDSRAYCAQDTDMSLCAEELGYRTYIDMDLVCEHIRTSNLRDEMRRMYQFGTCVPIMFERHPKYREMLHTKRIINTLLTFAFPLNLLFYLRKTAQIKHAVIAWLLSLSYNVGWLSTFWLVPISRSATKSKRYYRSA
jgi:glycosyltransferase involved in cell wall biosynthesis